MSKKCNDMSPYRLLVSKVISKELCRLVIVLEGYEGNNRSEYITYSGKRYRIPTVEEISGYLRYECGIECIVGYDVYSNYKYDPMVFINGVKADGVLWSCEDYEEALLECIEYGVNYLVENNKELDRRLGKREDSDDDIDGECISYEVEFKKL